MHCAFRKTCLPAELSDSEIGQFEQIVAHPPLVRADRSLQWPGNAPHAVFAIRAGAVKTFLSRRDGEEQITGLRLAGEVVGLENLGGGSTESGIQTLQHTLLCRIPLVPLSRLLGSLPGLQHRVFSLLSHEIYQELELIREIAGRRADQRLAYLLLDISQRGARNGGLTERFELPLRYRELADYLGLAHETVSRLFKRFEEKGLVQTAGRQVRIADFEALARLAGEQGLAESHSKQHGR